MLRHVAGLRHAGKRGHPNLNLEPDVELTGIRDRHRGLAGCGVRGDRRRAAAFHVPAEPDHALDRAAVVTDRDVFNQVRGRLRGAGHILIGAPTEDRAV